MHETKTQTNGLTKLLRVYVWSTRAATHLWGISASPFPSLINAGRVKRTDAAQSKRRHETRSAGTRHDQLVCSITAQQDPHYLQDPPSPYHEDQPTQANYSPDHPLPFLPTHPSPCPHTQTSKLTKHTSHCNGTTTFFQTIESNNNFSPLRCAYCV